MHFYSFDVPRTIAGSEDTAVYKNITVPVPHGIYIIVSG
jgi:hypothetical protein